MADDFVSRLTDEQIELFLKKEFAESRYSHLHYFRDAKAGIRVSAEVEGIMDDETLNVVFEDFSVPGAVDESKWCQYLYNVFGEPWKEAYIKHCLMKVGIS